MALNDGLLAEFNREMAITRRMLERIPDDKLAWKPHEKSMSLARLASHIAQTPVWMTKTISTPEFDFASMPYSEDTFDSSSDIVKRFDETVAEAVSHLEKATPESLMEHWKFRAGDTIYMDDPRIAAARFMCMSHLIHHRGQLSVYLRELDVPLPSVYGPTADES